METSAHMIRHWLPTIDSYSSTSLYELGTIKACSTTGETEAQRVGAWSWNWHVSEVLIAGLSPGLPHCTSTGAAHIPTLTPGPEALDPPLITDQGSVS